VTVTVTVRKTRAGPGPGPPGPSDALRVPTAGALMATVFGVPTNWKRSRHTARLCACARGGAGAGGPRAAAMASEAWSEMLVRRRSSSERFERTPSAYDGITREELAELKALYFLDDEQVATYISSFQKYDEDKSGDIDSKEIVMLLRDLGLNFPEADVFDMIQAVDVDGSGTIGVPEFITLIADPDGPLGLALADDAHAVHVDPRQAFLKRKHLEVKIKNDLLLRSSRANFIDNLQLRADKFADAESGFRGWVGFAGCAAVAVSENGLLLAAAGNNPMPLVERYKAGMPRMQTCQADI